MSLLDVKTFFYIEALLCVGIVIVRALLSREDRRLIDMRAIVLVLVLPATGYLLPGGRYVFSVAVLLLLPMLARSRAEAARLYLMAVPMMPMLNYLLGVPGISYLIRISYPYLLVFGFLIAFVAHKRTGPAPGFRPLDFAMVLFWLLFTTFTLRIAGGEASTTTVTNMMRAAIETALQTVIPYFLLSRSLGNPARLRDAMGGLAIAVLLLACVGSFEMVRHWPLYQGMYQHIGIDQPGLSLTLRVRGGLLRAPGPFSESTSFGFFLAICAAAVVSLRSMFRSRAHHIAAILLLIFGLLATSSRGAWLALAGGMLVLFLYRRQYMRIALSVAAGAVIYAMALAVAASSTRAGEFLGVAGVAARTADYRKDLLQQGLALFRRSPLLGSDQISISHALSQLVTGEGIIDYVNSYLFILVYSGVIGMAIFLFPPAVLAGWLGKVRTRLSRDPRRREQLLLIVMGMGALFSGIMFTSFADRNLLWFIIFFAFGRAFQAEVRAARPASRDPAAGMPRMAEVLP